MLFLEGIGNSQLESRVHLYGNATEKNFARPTSWVEQCLRNHPDRENCINQAAGDSDMVPKCGLCWGGFNKGTMASASTSAWEKAAHPALVLMPNNLVFPHLPQAPLELLT